MISCHPQYHESRGQSDYSVLPAQHPRLCVLTHKFVTRTSQASIFQFIDIDQLHLGFLPSQVVFGKGTRANHDAQMIICTKYISLKLRIVDVDDPNALSKTILNYLKSNYR